MKTMVSMDKKIIKRVTDEKAAELYHDGGWMYTTKSNKMSKSAKRHMRKTNR